MNTLQSMMHTLESTAQLPLCEPLTHDRVVQERDTPRWDPQVLTHLTVLGLIVVGTVLLRFYPGLTIGASIPCAMRVVFHLNCPFCGMTRDFVAILHGNHPKFNVFSWPMAACLYVVYPSVFLWAWKRQRLNMFYLPAVYRAGMGALFVMFVVNNLFS